MDPELITPEIVKMFAEFDTDKDGVLSMEELAAGLTKLDPTMTRQDFAEMVRDGRPKYPGHPWDLDDLACAINGGETKSQRESLKEDVQDYKAHFDTSWQRAKFV